MVLVGKAQIFLKVSPTSTVKSTFTGKVVVDGSAVTFTPDTKEDKVFTRHLSDVAIFWDDMPTISTIEDEIEVCLRTRGG